MEELRIVNKLKLLFEKIVEPKYIMNTYYAESLINKLTKNPGRDMFEVCNMPVLSDLISEAWSHMDTAHNSVQVFLARFTAVVAAKELHFTKIFHKQSKQILKMYQTINSPATNPSLKVAAMEVALGIVKHNSGISWLLETGVWKEILSLCNEKQTVFVDRQVNSFAAAFLWRLSDLCDQVNVKLVLGHILKLFELYDFLNIESLSSEEEENLAKNLDPILHILLAIVSTEQRIDKYSILLDTLVRDIKINSHLLIVFDRMRREESCLLLSKLVFWFTFAKIFLNKPAEPGVKFTYEDFIDLSVTYFNMIQFMVQRRNASLALDFGTACNLICYKVCKDKETVIWVTEERRLILRNQMLFMCLVPLIVFVKHGKADANSDEKLQGYIVKLMNASCEHTAKAAYALRSLLTELDTIQIVVQSVKRLSCLKNHLHNDQANMMFQALFYILREYDPIDDFGEAKMQPLVHQYEDDQTKVLVMTYVMETVHCLVKHHNINWHESLEVICLYTVVHSILQRSNLTTKFVVAALNTITVTVKKFLPPNLSLLLESQPGSAMDHIGKLIYMKLHDLSWEVRDSALELMLVCIDISYVKFPPFQKQILDNGLMNVGAALALNELEPYVQASALRCLGAASKITSLWDDLKTQYPNIQDQLIATLCNNQEGIVRKEACNVLCEIYQNIKISAVFKQTLYSHMLSSALTDFHWEVQICALKFWKIVIHCLLTDQGMLDGTFPPVTFSRESRKIVTLNEAEIQKILMKTLDELSSIGLLTVLIKLLHEDTEVEVLDSAVTLAQELIDIIYKYKVNECLKPKEGDIESVDEIACHMKQENDEFNMADETVENDTSDHVIEGILNSDDINLLSSIYERHMTLQSVKQEKPVVPKVELTKVASPYLFMNHFKSKDFKVVADEKRKWNDGIRNISSLLDDVLGIYELDEEVNALDCY